MLPMEALRITIERKFGTFPCFIIYAFLEWVEVILLLLDGFITFVSNEIARLFDLRSPCLLCTRFDHDIFLRGSNFYYNNSICEVHKKDLSNLTYCHVHKRLSDIRTMCQGCLKDKDSDCEDKQKSHLKPLRKDEMEILADMCRCSCCGEPMKSKSSSKFRRTLSICSPAHSPRAPWFSVRNNEGGSMDLSPKLIPDTDFDLQEVEILDNHGREDAKAVAVSLLPNTEEMSGEAPMAPIFTSTNRFCGIPLTDAAPVSPKCDCSGSKKLPEKPELLVEPITDEMEGDGDVLARLKRQINQDRRSLMALYMELDAERNASAVAANNAMAMITRLQAEKAAVQMEASQYQRMMEEQAEYDKEAVEMMQDVVLKKEEEVKALEVELKMYTEKYGVIKKIGSEICEVDDDDYQDMNSQALSSSSEKSEDQHENEHAYEDSVDSPGGISDELALDYEGEKSHLLGLLRQLEKKKYSTSDEASTYPELRGGDGEDEAVVTRDVSLIRERLRAVEAESGFLKRAAMTLQKGGEGMRVLTEIAQHLRKLRQNTKSPSEETDV